MKEIIYFKGKPLTLVGRVIEEGSRAPDFSVVDADLVPVGLDTFKGRIKVITTFLSLDTPVCDLQVKEFNKKAAQLDEAVAVIGISKDLPFAQKRFCRENSIKDVITLSDYKTSSLGLNYGLLIKEMNLLARAVLILDKSDILRYKRVCSEQTQAPDYNSALEALSGVLKDPASSTSRAQEQKCVPCEGKVPALTEQEAQSLMRGRELWQSRDGKSIAREFTFADFADAKYFLDEISLVAQEQGHHPSFRLSYNKLKVTLTTHAAGGLTRNDFIMAGIIDQLAA